jgi:hypothetical protein
MPVCRCIGALALVQLSSLLLDQIGVAFDNLFVVYSPILGRILLEHDRRRSCRARGDMHHGHDSRVGEILEM